MDWIVDFGDSRIECWKFLCRGTQDQNDFVIESREDDEIRERHEGGNIYSLYVWRATIPVGAA